MSENAAGTVEGEMHSHKGGYLKYKKNDWNMGELVDMMDRRSVDVLCLQETNWKGSKAKNIEGDYKLFFNGADGKKYGIGIVVREDLIESVLEISGCQTD